MLRYLPLVLRNAWRNRRRTVLTIASIGVSMCLLGVMLSVYHALYLSDPTPEQALRLVTRNRVSLTQILPESYGARIRNVAGVQSVMISSWFGGVYKDARDPKNFFARLIVEPAKLFDTYKDITIPEDQRRAFERERTACVIGRDLANKFNFHLGDRIHLIGDIYPGDYEFTIRGIFDSSRPSEIMYISRDYLEQSLSEQRRGAAGTFVTVIDRAESAPRIARAIDDMFRNSPVETKTESEQAYLLGFVSMLGNVKMILIGISAAVMFTILLVSANTMAMSVRERVREVGILKTLGFAPGTILGIILSEACAISLAGGLIGFFLSVFVTGGVRNSPAGAFLPPVSPFEPAVALACVATAGAIGLVSSLMPALGASRTTIVQALRSTE
jgi:putative ABC transport system permease protein